MRYYAVYAMQRSEDHTGKVQVAWFIVGVFKAGDAETACQAAAKKRQAVGSFFAVEGYPWGIDLTEIDASEFGLDTEQDRKMRELEERGANIEASLTRLQQLEVKSREMERDAGIGD